MNMKMKRSKAIACLALMLAALLMMSGCSALRGKNGAPASSQPNAAAQTDNGPVYYDFGDVLLPREMKVEKEESFVFSTPGLTAGVLSLSGRVEVNSLIAFFENKMPADGWRMISEFKAPRTMMLFKKNTRWCVISITEGQLNTNAEIWVSPTIEGRERGLQK